MPSRRSDAPTRRRTPMKFTTASPAPTATPRSTGVENHTAAPRMSTAANTPFQRSILARSLGPIVFLILGCGCLARRVVHSLEAGGDAEEDVDQHQPGFRSQPAVEEVVDPEP